ncbi:hypothetical protein ACPCXD_10635 [Rhodococcus sp. AB351]
MIHRRGCTCAGTAPGWPQHEPYCATATASVSVDSDAEEWHDEEATEWVL